MDKINHKIDRVGRVIGVNQYHAVNFLQRYRYCNLTVSQVFFIPNPANRTEPSRTGSLQIIGTRRNQDRRRGEAGLQRVR